MLYYLMILSREYRCITLLNFIFPFLFVVVLSILGPRHWLPTIAFLIMIVVSYCLPPQFERTLRQQLWIILPVVVSLVVEAKSEASDTMIRIVLSVIAFVSILQLVPCNTPSSSDAATEEQCIPDEGFRTFLPNFRPWLQCLHVVLIAPILLSFLLPKRWCRLFLRRSCEVDTCIKYWLLAVGKGAAYGSMTDGHNGR